MFEITLDDTQTAICEMARDIGRNVLYPVARAAETAGELPAREWGTLIDTGLVAPVDPRHGGGGIPDAATHLLGVLELAAGDPAGTAAAVWSGNAALLIGLCGTDEQKDEFLPRFVDDPNSRGSVAYLEGFGRQPSELLTTISADADADGWLIRGHKAAVAHALQADPMIVIGADPSTGNLRASILAGTEAAATVTKTSVHVGLDAVPLAEISVDLHVPESRILGGPNADPGLLVAAVSWLRLTTSALALGGALRSREYASYYATTRMAFGRTLSGFQGVAFLMAEAHSKFDAARLQMLAVAARLQEPIPADLERRTSLAVNYATMVAASITRDGIQVLGGHGYIADHPVERWYRAAAGLASLDFDVTCSAFAAAL